VDDLGPPAVGDGVSMLEAADLPGFAAGDPEFNGVNVDSIEIVRRDVDVNRTQLFLTVVARTGRGEGMVADPMRRAVQQVFTIEPADFDGFDYAMLANNVNCIFCHTRVESVETFFDMPDANGNFKRVKVGTLESLMLRHDMDGIAGHINDGDADSTLTGTLYTRGEAVLHDGSPITNWSDLSFLSQAFDSDGNLLPPDSWGDDPLGPFVPAGDPPDQNENLYLNYSDDYTDMVDGTLPTSFPAPIPDDGGTDPGTGLPAAGAAGNKVVDDAEFLDVAATATGSLGGGIVNVVPPGSDLSDVGDLANALLLDSGTVLNGTVDGNVVITGTEADPIVIDGTVAIDGDVVLTGYIKGEGTLIVRGNAYIPSDVQYLDGREYLEGDTPGNPTGPRTFGIDADGNKNALGLTAGGNIVVGDYTRPSTLQFDETWQVPGPTETISGNPDTGDPNVDQWSFTLAEMSLFNRGEWAKTMQYLPKNEAEAALDQSLWTASNPNYVEDYVPRYYAHDDGSTIPIFNKQVWWNESSGTWGSHEEVPIGWDSSLLSYADPTNTSDPYFYDGGGNPKAVLYSLAPTNDWLPDANFKLALNYLQGIRPAGQELTLDGLLYTNNAIFSLVPRASSFYGRMVLNGSIVAADIGVLAPGYPVGPGWNGNTSALSDFAVGLQLNYDQRLKDLLNVRNPFQVELKRTLWNPTRSLL